MKIAFDGKRFFSNTSGLGNYSRDLLRMMAVYLPENQYVIFNTVETERGSQILKLPNVSFRKTTAGRFARQLKMGKDAQEADCDVFHGLSGELPLKWSKKPIKKIVTIHDLIFLRFPKYYSFFDRKIHFWKFKKAAEQADLIIAISEQTKRDIITFLKIDERKIRVVYQGCHPSFKEVQTSAFLDSVKEKYGLPDQFILNVGTIEERKNLLNIVKAITGTDIPLVVIGKKTKYYGKVANLIKKNKLQNQIFFLDKVSMTELAAVYKLAEIFVYPSFFEGFGIPIIEALFSGTPVITANISSLPEAGGQDALYINPGSVHDLKAKILFLWNNEAERKRRAEKGLEYAQTFSDKNIADDLMKVYREVFSRNSF